MEDEVQKNSIGSIPHYHYPGDGSGDLFQGYSFFRRTVGAATIYILLRNQMLYLIEKKHMKKA